MFHSHNRCQIGSRYIDTSYIDGAMPPAPLVAPGITFGDAAEMDPVPAHVPQLDERSGGSTKTPGLLIGMRPRTPIFS